MTAGPRIGLLGYNGRMGQAIAHAIAENKDCILTAALVRKLSEPAPQHILLSTDIDAVMQACDIAIDFTAADLVTSHINAAQKAGRAIIVGTTGLDEAAKAALKQTAATIPVLYAPNTSLSLVAMKRMTELAARLLSHHDYDIAILDEHHRMKKDAPSGTALALGEAITRGNQALKQPSYAAIRAGHIVGNHEVIFTGNGETIRLHHSVTDRAIFARGALEAALWLAGKPPGLYGMEDVLGNLTSKP